VHTRYFRGRSRCEHTGHEVDYCTPADLLSEREEAEATAAAMESVEAAQEMLRLDVLPEVLRELIHQAAFDAFRQCEEMWIDWLFEDGPSPLLVLRRLYLLVRKKRSQMIWNMGYRDLGKLFDVSHEALRYQCKALFGDAPGGATKTPAARAKMRQSAFGNANRRGGHKANGAPVSNLDSTSNHA
jgi:hypothetical protein